MQTLLVELSLQTVYVRSMQILVNFSLQTVRRVQTLVEFSLPTVRSVQTLQFPLLTALHLVPSGLIKMIYE